MELQSDLRDVGPNLDKGAALISLDGCVGWVESHRHSDDRAPARFFQFLTECREMEQDSPHQCWQSW